MGGTKLCSVEMVGQQYVYDDFELQYMISNNFLFLLQTSDTESALWFL